MKFKHIITASLAFMLLPTIASKAQTMYDITDNYLQNNRFDDSFDYDTLSTTNVRNAVKAIAGWQKNTTASTSAVAATFQFGTQAKVNGKVVPATGYAGTDEGGFVAFWATNNKQLVYEQDVQLPAGRYALVYAYYNCNTASTAGTSLFGWAPSSGEPCLSAISTFEPGEWRTDTIAFELTETARGKMQMGFKADLGSSYAILAVDFVKLLRDQPFGDIDITGNKPAVTTDTRFARGATMAFGRMTASLSDGGTITEQGFCWSEHPDPTVDDAVTTKTLSNNGTIYWIDSLKPATKYYMRAYAKTAGRNIGYGDVIKFYTLPKGNVTYWYNNGGDAAANKRVNTAAADACDIFNNLTSIVKHFAIGYSAGTPTADCYYADEPWMNMGANSSYQRTGTIMHEMQHGLGLVPYTTQWNKNILREKLDGDGRGTGHWLGDRVSDFLNFWDNTTGSRLNGDYQHMWPYGINGAHEDNGTRELYFANAMIGQALGEDGLEHRSNRFAEPYYSFNQEDTVKYYIKNENEMRGRFTAYLMPKSNGQLTWHEMSAKDAVANDSTAWTITFTPENQYYQLRNVATGQYLTYSSGIRTAAREALTENDNFHLMKGRVNVRGNNATPKRGYWIIHPTNNLSPICMQAALNGGISNGTFNIDNSATNQRWLILTEEELSAYDKYVGASITDMQQSAEVETTSSCYYDLQGRRIAKPSRGLYIVGGKKIVVR